MIATVPTRMTLVMLKRGRILLAYTPLSASTSCIDYLSGSGTPNSCRICTPFSLALAALFIGILVELGAMLLEPAPDDVRFIIRIRATAMLVKSFLAIVRGDPVEK